MRLHEVHEGELYGTDYRTVHAGPLPSELEAVGTVPVPVESGLDVGLRLKTTKRLKSVLEAFVGDFPTVNVWPNTEGTLVASAVRWLHVSTDGGRSWEVTYRLPESSGPMGVLPSAFCEHDGTLYVGEYPLDGDETPHVLRSRDGGRTWDTALSLPGVRHVHAIEADPYTGDLWMTTGDAGDECRIGRIRDGGFEAVGRGTQHWRAVQPVFTPTGVLWGVDSVYSDENPLFELPRSEFGCEDPAVRRLSTVENSVYYGASLTVDGECWAVFSTAIEPGTDSTGPDDQPSTDGQASVVAASSATNYTDWVELAAYRKRTVPADLWPLRSRLPIANAYIYLAADDDGLLLNPYNTADDDGRILRIPKSRFAELDTADGQGTGAVADGVLGCGPR
jgi:hypothetical protein